MVDVCYKSNSHENHDAPLIRKCLSNVRTDTSDSDLCNLEFLEIVDCCRSCLYGN